MDYSTVFLIKNTQLLIGLLFTASQYNIFPISIVVNPLSQKGGMKLIVFPDIPEIIPLRKILLEILVEPNIVATNKYQESIS